MISTLLVACDNLAMQTNITRAGNSIGTRRAAALASGLVAGGRPVGIRRTLRMPPPSSAAEAFPEPAADKYPFIVRVAIVGGLAVAAWGGVIIAALGLIRHFA